MTGCKETLCSKCEHRKVCSFKEQFLRAQAAVDTTFVGTDERSGKYLRDFDWIKPVELQCVHFMKTPDFNGIPGVRG